jgi:hypothetical protein
MRKRQKIKPQAQLKATLNRWLLQMTNLARIGEHKLFHLPNPNSTKEVFPRNGAGIFYYAEEI